MILCTNCKRGYPASGLPYRCPVCGGVYDFEHPLEFNTNRIDRSQPGIWRWGSSFGLSEAMPQLSLGEGNTPLVWRRVFGRKVAFKCEYLNPTGSFKDRGTAVITPWLVSRGIQEAVEDSSGNAGASFAAYAARAGIKASIFVPVSSSGPKRHQIGAYGADLIPIQGSRADVSNAVLREAENGVAYASHAWLPFNLPGYATAAYEIYEQLGEIMPGAIVVPAGQGGLLLGLSRGFDALRVANSTSIHMNAKDKSKQLPVKMPRIIGVQAKACAPLWALFTAGREGIGFISEHPTLAEGVKVRYPVKADLVLQAVAESEGTICVVDEVDIGPGSSELARLGLYVEPTSAIVWNALEQELQSLRDPVVVVLTGTGFKYSAL